MQNNYDVIVIGAGPAGISTALECTKAGLAILLIEESKLTETEKSWVTFQDAVNNYPLLKKAITNKVNRLKFYGVNQCFDSGATLTNGYVIEQSLLNRAYEQEINKFKNCHILDKTLYQKAERKNGCVKVQTSQGMFTGKIIVDASGSYSVVANDLMIPNSNFWFLLCYFLRIQRRDGLIDYQQMVFAQGGNEARSRGAMGALYPNSRDYFDIGVGDYLKSGKDTEKTKIELKEKIVNFWNFLQKNGIIKEKVKIDFSKEFYGGIRVTPRKNIYGDNIIIVGDAAGQGSPITGEGLRTGLYYGEMAAEAIVRAVKNDDYKKNGLKLYPILCKKKPLFGYRYGSIVQNLIRNNLVSPPFKRFQKLYDKNPYREKCGLTLMQNAPLSFRTAFKLLIKFYL